MTVTATSISALLSSGGTFSLSAGSDRFIAVTVLNRSTVVEPSSVTFGGSTVAKVISQAGTSSYAWIGTYSPGTMSSGNKVVSFSNGYGAIVYELAGASTTSPIYSSGGTQAASSPSSIGLNSKTGAYAIDAITFFYSQTSLTTGGSQTADNGADLRINASHKSLLSTGTTSMSWSGTWGATNGHCAAVIDGTDGTSSSFIPQIIIS